MRKLTKARTYRELFDESVYPQLYSRRGLEKSRIKIIVPAERTEKAYVTDQNGNKLNIKL